MTHTDFIIAVSRYCGRLSRCNARPEHITRTRATLRDFLREVVQDMEEHPELFEHPVWGARGPGRESLPGSAGHQHGQESDPCR